MFSLPVVFDLCLVQKILAPEVSPVSRMLMAARLSSEIGTPDKASREIDTNEFKVSYFQIWYNGGLNMGYPCV